MRFLCAEDNELNAEIFMELLKIEGAELKQIPKGYVATYGQIAKMAGNPKI